jgi:predicted transcriptional regulator
MAKNGIKWTPELEKELYTAAEIEENNLQAKLLCELIDARQKKGISQRDLEALSGISQTSIARIESGATNNPTLETLFKLLTPLGMTMKIVPLTAKR